MNDRQALLQAVLDDPDDDLVRLVFADWLQENGEEDFAEYVRVEVRWAGLAADPDADPEDYRKYRRLQRGYVDFQPWPVDHLPQWCLSAPRQRGWIDKLACSLTQWCANGGAITEREPVRTVRLQSDWSEPSWSEVFRTPGFGRLRRLELLGNSRSDMRVAIARSFRSDALEELSIQDLTPEGLQALFSQFPPRLRSLGVALQYGDSEGMRLMTETLSMEELRVLNLSHSWLGSEPLKLFTGSPTFRNLETLWLASISGRADESEWMRSLCRDSQLVRLKRLNLAENWLTDLAAKSIAESGAMGQLRSLDLRTNSITARGFAELLGSPVLQYLESLDISHSGGKWRKGLFSKRGGLPALKILNVASTQLSDDAVADLMRCPASSGLETLDLTGNTVGVAGFAAMRTNSGLCANLRTLTLKGCRIGDDGAAEFARIPWQKLRTLNLEECVLTPVGAVAIAESDYLQSLQVLRVGNNRLDRDFGRFLKGLGRLPHLHTLEVDCCWIGRHGIDAILGCDWLGRLLSLNLMNNTFDFPSQRRLHKAFGEIVVL